MTSPTRPGPDPLALEILEGLQGSPGASEIVLGGYFALSQYLDYRGTHDLDAWWRTGRNGETMSAICAAMEGVARGRGLVLTEREWGETVSFELRREGGAIFSFQIALRSVELAPASASRWPPIQIESLDDTVGSKMNALVQRGAPRDFRDIREVVQRGLMTAQECWGLWMRKNPGRDPMGARANVLRHLQALERRRPLAEIADAVDREASRMTREWVRVELLALPSEENA